MADQHNFSHQVWRAATLTVALFACLIVGVLASRDWVSGGIIVAASTVGLTREIPVIRKLCSTEYPGSPREHKPAK